MEQFVVASGVGGINIKAKYLHLFCKCTPVPDDLIALGSSGLLPPGPMQFIRRDHDSLF
jgi:hypothetical protein